MRPRHLGLLLLAALTLQGCRLQTPGARPATSRVDQLVTVNGHALVIHLAYAAHPAHPAQPGPRPLLIYTTGDGGWRGKDRALFEALASTGYPVAGISAPEYLKPLHGEHETTTPIQLAQDYDLVLETARATLGLPVGPVILVGVSRGAGLSVVAAGSRVMRRELSGVVAIALTKEEEYVRWRGRRRRRRSAPDPVMVQVYDYLPQLRDLPLAVVQSTHDNYLPAADARTLFGPDSPTRRLRAIEARNHSFSGAREQMYAATREALEWIRQAAGPPRIN